MSKVSLSGLLFLCAALAASSNADTKHTLTGPDVRPSRNEVPDDLRGASTMDGPADVSFARGASSTQMAVSVNAATGGRASGHLERDGQR